MEFMENKRWCLKTLTHQAVIIYNNICRCKLPVIDNRDENWEIVSSIAGLMILREIFDIMEKNQRQQASRSKMEVPTIWRF